MPPHELLHALWRAGEHVFIGSLLGEEGPDLAADFWNVALEAPWYQSHPGISDAKARSRTLPIFYHVDGAEVFNNTEYYFWSWSCLARGPSLDVKFPIMGIPAACMVKKDVKKDVIDKVTHFLCWCDEFLRSGVGPVVGYRGEPFHERSLRYQLCGQRLAGDWRACFAGFKADANARKA